MKFRTLSLIGSLFVSLSLYSGSSFSDEPKISEAEVQMDVQRFASEQIDLTVQAIEDAQKQLPESKQPILKRNLLRYVSALLEISTGPSAAANLLDMITFMRLSRQSLEIYYIPEVYGAAGKGLHKIFKNGESEAWSILAKVVSREKQVELKNIIDSWRRKHPTQVRVEGIRFKEFSKFAGLNAGETEKAKGLVSSIKSATAAADRALLLAERSIFLAQRMPFLLRLQAVIGSGEMTAEISEQFEHGDEMLGEVRKLDPLIKEVSNLVSRSTTLLIESKKLVEVLRPGEARRTLIAAADFTEKALELLREVDRTNLIGVVEAALQRERHLTLKWTSYLLLIGLGWATFWWGGYYLAKRNLKTG